MYPLILLNWSLCASLREERRAKSEAAPESMVGGGRRLRGWESKAEEVSDDRQPPPPFPPSGGDTRREALKYSSGVQRPESPARSFALGAPSSSSITSISPTPPPPAPPASNGCLYSCFLRRVRSPLLERISSIILAAAALDEPPSQPSSESDSKPPGSEAWGGGTGRVPRSTKPEESGAADEWLLGSIVEGRGRRCEEKRRKRRMRGRQRKIHNKPRSARDSWGR
mmetsp:Transcript_29234/g.58376  ORF Transcript_29234/g.58376 Transcript_29234/m.58376 type:complete len:226 (-) Transcript_29234:61-738(-)